MKPKYLSITSFPAVLIFIFLWPHCDSATDGMEGSNFEWSFSTPVSEKIDPVQLDSAFVAAENTGYMDALLVVQNGRLIRESYFNGYHEDDPHNVMSVSKSFLSVIAGVAHEMGYISNLDTAVLDYFPEYITPNMDNRKYDITLRHLLTMQMGIASESDNSYELYMELYNSDDWIAETLDLPLISAPGEAMHYNTFQTHLLSAVITRAAGCNTLKFARQHLFEKMKIDCDQWEKGPQGYYFGGNSMYFTPREMAVLGLLVLNRGLIDDEQLISEKWIDLMLTKTRPADAPAWGVLRDYNYGYLWWLGKINDFQLFMALGYGGQTVLVFPELDLIVVTTANENIMPDVDHERPILDIVSRYILPSLF
ncbi:MAG: serine hydrolase [Candidatus Marinimicrobia bacterium]|nr:serine hydrolase [Candidatus Neomarinimicrobiota bacterium]